ncbi:MAG: aspartate kinase, partial [Akkermansia sp.]|nr:aspartate kinase [Akkermansia sp.]
MALIVQKYGGSSVGTIDRIRNVARRLIEVKKEGNKIMAVISAMSGVTDKLIGLAHEVMDNPPERELDMLLATGEQISVALCAMALEGMGLRCVSLAAWQVGIQSSNVHSDARI